jgi:hypothetical protein
MYIIICYTTLYFSSYSRSSYHLCPTSHPYFRIFSAFTHFGQKGQRSISPAIAFAIVFLLFTMIYGYIIGFSSIVLTQINPILADINANLRKCMAIFIFAPVLVMSSSPITLPPCFKALQSMSTISLLRCIIYFDNISLFYPNNLTFPAFQALHFRVLPHRLS